MNSVIENHAADEVTLVSVVMPVYREVKYLPRAIESALAQTGVNVELLIIDDGSPEDVRSAVQPYIDRPEVRLQRQENRGVSAARNHGLRLARGQFIAFLDHDDEWYPQKLSVQLAALAAYPAAALCHGDVDYMDAEGVDLPHAPDFPAPVYGACLGRMLMGNPIITSTVVMRRNVIDWLGGFDESLRHAEDYDMWLRAAAGGVPSTLATLSKSVANNYSGTRTGIMVSDVAYVDAPVARYRVHARSATRQTAAMLAATLNVVHRVLDQAADSDKLLSADDRRLRVARLHCGLSCHYFTQRQWLLFVQHWLAAFRENRQETFDKGLPGSIVSRLRWYRARLGLR